MRLNELTQNGKEELYLAVRRLIANGNDEAIVFALENFSYKDKQSVIKAVVDADYRPVMNALFDQLKSLTGKLDLGGSEVHLMREKTVRQLEQGLMQMTGIEADPSWTSSVRLSQLSKKIESIRLAEMAGAHGAKGAIMTSKIPESPQNSSNASSKSPVTTVETSTDMVLGRSGIQLLVLLVSASSIIVLFVFRSKKRQ